MLLSFAEGTFAALAALPVALVFLMAYGNRAKSTRPSLMRARAVRHRRG
jgi:hypothetical protein